MASLLLCLVLAGAAPDGPVFAVRSIPVASSDALVMLAPASGDGPQVVVLEGNSLRLIGQDEDVLLALPEDTRMFDVADIDGDGRAEVLVVAGTRLLLGGPGAESQPCPLTELCDFGASPLGIPGQPSPRVLAVTLGKETRIAVPFPDAIELRDPAGALVSRHVASSLVEDGTDFAPFLTWHTDPPQVAPPDGLETRVSHVVEPVFDLPSEMVALPPPVPAMRFPTPAQVREAANVDPSMWPWFPLERASESRRILYAVRGNTVIRVCGGETAASPRPEAPQYGPERSYPGVIVIPKEPPPDFNGDGYSDMLLWSSPEPGYSVHSLTRAVHGRTWPIRLAAYVFSPAKVRYEPLAAGQIDCELPLSWFFMMESGAPMRHLVLADFNGDAKTDCGFSPEVDAFSVWCFDAGFSKQPLQEMRFGEPILEVAVCARLAGQSGASVILRTTTAIHVLRAIR